jgi:septal ring factor EnvC (AmiA/AmiB activator)
MKKSALKQVIFILLLLIGTQICCAQSFTNKLADVITKIKNIRQELLANHTAQADAQKHLQNTETSINSLSLELSKTTTQLQQQEQSLQALLIHQKKIELKITRTQHALLQEIKAQYLLGLNRNKTQLILNAKDFHKIERLLRYSHYLTKQTSEKTLNLKQDLAALEDNKKLMVNLTNQTQDLQKQQISQQKNLRLHQEQQKALLTNLDHQVKTKSQQLAELLKNKENLERTIQNLQKKPTSFKSDYLTHHKGRFPWPTEGKILEHFGSNIADSELKQNGVLINAPEGQKVYAVAPGKVIFANWMPGYGLLLIIDHGKGYMTLYGNNGVLYKKNKDIVGEHDLIAKVGHTGGQRKPVLYFALRYQGKPINPSTWCG